MLQKAPDLRVVHRSTSAVGLGRSCCEPLPLQVALPVILALSALGWGLVGLLWHLFF